MMKCPAAIKIFVHKYDYALPSGKGIFGNPSDWLKPALDVAKVPLPIMQAAWARLIIDEFSKMLLSIEKLGGESVVFVDSRKTLGPSHWANEIHSTPPGFKKIANTKWFLRFAANGLT
jgi:hypothetical protein